MKNVALPRQAGQQGFTLLELTATMVIMAFCSVPLVISLTKFAQSKRNDAIGLMAVNLHKAVDQYITQNAATIAAQPMPYTITPAMLSRPAAYLDPSYSTTNTMGQAPAIRVWMAADGSLEAVIATTGGQAIKDGDLDDIAAYMVKNGAAGGSIQTGATSVATGFQGSWSRDLSQFGLAPGAGHLVDFLTYTASATVDDALHRTSHPGNPSLNTMSTNILMAGHAVQGASDVKFNAGNQGITFFGGGEAIWGTTDYGVSIRTGSAERMKVRNDGSVAFSGRIATSGMDPNDCPSGWGCGVRTYDVLASSVIAAGNSATQNFWINSAGNGNFTGTLNGNIYSGNQYSGNEYYANGWYRLNGATGLYWQAYGGGWTMRDGTWIRAVNDKSIYTGGQVQAGSLQSNSTISAADRITSGEYVQVNGYASLGGSCDGSGGALLGRSNDGTNQMLMCKNGVWSALGGFSRTTWVMAQGHGSATAICPDSWTLISGGFGWGWSGPARSGEGLTWSAPDGNGWTAAYDNLYSGTLVIAYAICAQ